MAKALQHPQYLAHRFVAIHRSNWTPGRGGNKPQFVICHIMQGTYNGSISWAQNPASNVSWHYAIARDGHTTQNLGEHQTAWTNSNFWYNQRAVTIEHGGYVSQGGPTEAQLHASAKITAGICYRYGIPVNRKRILGHYQIPGANKPCPGANWPWKKYIQLVKAYRYPKADKPTKPPVQSDIVYRGTRWEWCQDNSAPCPAILTYDDKDVWRVERTSSNPERLQTMSRWEWCQDNSAPAPVVLTYDGGSAWKVTRI